MIGGFMLMEMKHAFRLFHAVSKDNLNSKMWWKMRCVNHQTWLENNQYESMHVRGSLGMSFDHMPAYLEC